MSEANKRQRSSSFSNDPSPLSGGPILKRQDSSAHVEPPQLLAVQHPVEPLAPQLPPPKPQRHAFLPGLAAFDPNHAFAAALELRAHKTDQSAKYGPGHLFVESDLAKQSVTSLLTAKRQATQNVAEQADIDHALSHIHVLGQQAQGPLGSGTGGDKLYVKGHGSPKNPDSISTVTKSRKKEQGVTLESGFKQVHSADQIAQGVNRVFGDLGADKLDVRLTSCGGAGGHVKAIDAESGLVSFAPRDKGDTFGGKVQAKLDELRADTFKVHAYRGDANTTFPVQGPLGTKHFRTIVKDDGSGHQLAELPKGFAPSAELNLGDQAKKKARSPQFLSQKGLVHPLPPVLDPSVSGASQATQSAFSLSPDKEHFVQVRRSSARVPFK